MSRILYKKFLTVRRVPDKRRKRMRRMLYIAVMAIFPMLGGCVVVMHDTTPTYRTYTRTHCGLCGGYGCGYHYHTYHRRTVVVREAVRHHTNHHHGNLHRHMAPAAPQRQVTHYYPVNPTTRQQASRGHQSIARQTTTRRTAVRRSTSTTQERVKKRRAAERTKRRR